MSKLKDAAGPLYPYLVEPQGEGWAVTFAEGRMPHQLLYFNHYQNALSFARKVNHSYVVQMQALAKTRALITKIQGQVSTPPEECTEN